MPTMPDFETITAPAPAPTGPATALRPADEDVQLSGEIREEGVFASLISSFRDVFFPAKLPPLVLESTPIAVADPMATKMSPSSSAGQTGCNRQFAGRPAPHPTPGPADGRRWRPA